MRRGALAKCDFLHESRSVGRGGRATLGYPAFLCAAFSIITALGIG